MTLSTTQRGTDIGALLVPLMQTSHPLHLLFHLQDLFYLVLQSLMQELLSILANALEPALGLVIMTFPFNTE